MVTSAHVCSCCYCCCKMKQSRLQQRPLYCWDTAQVCSCHSHMLQHDMQSQLQQQPLLYCWAVSQTAPAALLLGCIPDGACCSTAGIQPTSAAATYTWNSDSLHIAFLKLSQGRS
jgi:hypothetical protein